MNQSGFVNAWPVSWALTFTALQIFVRKNNKRKQNHGETTLLDKTDKARHYHDDYESQQREDNILLTLINITSSHNF